MSDWLIELLFQSSLKSLLSGQYPSQFYVSQLFLLFVCLFLIEQCREGDIPCLWWAWLFRYNLQNLETLSSRVFLYSGIHLSTSFVLLCFKKTKEWVTSYKQIFIFGFLNLLWFNHFKAMPAGNSADTQHIKTKENKWPNLCIVPVMLSKCL